MPDRIQRRRTAGWRMPAGAVYVGRPSPWGNPFAIRCVGPVPPKPAAMWGVFYSDRLLIRWDTKQLAAFDAVDRFRRLINEHRDLVAVSTSPYEIRKHLAGRDLVCWCPPGQPCHADVLLAVANPINVEETAKR